jgi:hypothetical protein
VGVRPFRDESQMKRWPPKAEECSPERAGEGTLPGLVIL